VLPDIGAPRPQGEITQAIKSAAAIADDLAIALRGIRNEELTRIGWRDLAGMAPLSEVIACLSELADASIEAALEKAHEEMV